MEGVNVVSDTIVALRDIHLRRGQRRILNGVTLDVARGDIVALMGASGSGKTTLLRAIAGLEPFDQGLVTVDDVTLSQGPAPRAVLAGLRRKVGMVFQFHCLFEHLTAMQNICLAPVHVQQARPADAERRANELLVSLGVEHRARALPRELSGGEAQRVAIARALATNPPVLLMDEPTASLDPARRQELAVLLRSLIERERLTIVVVTHDEEFAESAADRVVTMGEGRVSSPAADPS